MKIGDNVVLSSGGPRMTVIGFPEMVKSGPEEERTVWCAWFNGPNEQYVLMKEHFPIGALEAWDARYPEKAEDWSQVS